MERRSGRTQNPNDESSVTRRPCGGTGLGAFISERVDDISTILLGPQKNFIAAQSAHVKQSGIRYSETCIDEHPNEILDILSGPYPCAEAVPPCDSVQAIARLDDALEFLICEGDFVGDPACAQGRLQIARDGALREPFSVHAKSEKTA